MSVAQMGHLSHKSGFFGTGATRPVSKLPQVRARCTATVSARFRGQNTDFIGTEAFKRHETDTGSPEYQVARLTSRIKQLTKHLEAHRKDFATRRGMESLLGQRRSLLVYLFRTNRDGYDRVIKELGLRHVVDQRGRNNEIF